MINQKMEKAINRQINAELYSAYLYQAMHAWFASKNLLGFANWTQVQALEEWSHAMKFYGFVLERGGKAALEAVKAPPAEWKTPIDVFRHIYEHETKVTGMINDLVDLAIEIKDHASNQFFQWFVTEQVEEEANADAIVQKLAIAGDRGEALFMMDAELAARAFIVPPWIKVAVTVGPATAP